MDIDRRFSRRSLALVLLFLVALLLGIDTAFYWLLQAVPGTLVLETAVGGQPAMMLSRIESFLARLRQLELFFIPVSAAAFSLAALGLWGALRLTLERLLVRHAASAKAGARAAAAAAESDSGHQGRVLLHLLGVLQREGRLMDFLCEDLGRYDDAQVGAAVRGIQQNCQRVVRQTLAPVAIIEAEEGSRYTVTADADAAAIRLSGHVGGRPPFEGIVRHRGWRATRLELPALAGKADEHLIAPAEVEIL